MSVLGRARVSGPPVRVCFSGYSQACLKHDLKLIKNLKPELGAGLKKKKKQPLAQESTVGKKPRSVPLDRPTTRAGRRQISASLATGWRCCRAFGCTSARAWSASLEPGMEMRGGWGCGISVMNSELAAACG